MDIAFPIGRESIIFQSPIFLQHMWENQGIIWMKPFDLPDVVEWLTLPTWRFKYTERLNQSVSYALSKAFSIEEHDLQ